MIVYFDADDTLWYTNVLYERAYGEFADWALTRFDMSPEEIIQLVKSKDLERARSQGFHRTGFGLSMVAAYQELCERYGVQPSVAEALTAYRIGDSVHDDVPKLDDSAVEVLLDVGKDFEVNVLTMGDRVVQSAKLFLTGVHRYVSDALIVSRKEPGMYQEIAARNPGVPHVMVGNSKKSDIVPALEAGWFAVWLQYASTWEWDATHVELRHPRLHTVSELREVPKVIRGIWRRQQGEGRVG